MLDKKTGRWNSIDPFAEISRPASPFAYVGNNFVKYIDIDGNFRLDAAIVNKYPKLANYLQHGIQDVLNNPRIMGVIMKYGQLSRSQIEAHLTWGKGPEVLVKPIKSGAGGQFWPLRGRNDFDINIELVKLLESAQGLDKEVLLFMLGATILHEYVHYGDDQDGEYVSKPDAGELFEIAAYGQRLGDNNNAKKMWLDWDSRQKKMEEMDIPLHCRTLLIAIQHKGLISGMEPIERNRND